MKAATTLDNTVAKLTAVRAFDDLLFEMTQEYLKAGHDTDRLVYLHQYQDNRLAKLLAEYGVTEKQLCRDWENWFANGKK